MVLFRLGAILLLVSTFGGNRRLAWLGRLVLVAVLAVACHDLVT